MGAYETIFALILVCIIYQVGNALQQMRVQRKKRIAREAYLNSRHTRLTAIPGDKNE